MNLFISSTPIYDLLYESLRKTINQAKCGINTTTWFTKSRCVNRVAIGTVVHQHAQGVRRVAIE